MAIPNRLLVGCVRRRISNGTVVSRAADTSSILSLPGHRSIRYSRSGCGAVVH
jgi:hypothetical protein